MHEVEALIAEQGALVRSVSRLQSAVTCPLPQGLALLPITDALAKELADTHPQVTVPRIKPAGHALSDALHDLAVEISLITPVAFINTYYFGGQGGQDAVVWEKGSVQLSRATMGDDRIWPNSPISQALRMMGVVAAPGLDEFDTVGLGLHRRADRWAASAMN